MKKIAILLFLSLIAVSLGITASDEPSHPLKHIHPINTDFNLSGQDIFNVSELRIWNGLQINGNEIEDSGNVDILVWDSTNDEWDVKNADLNLNGNNLSGFFDSACGSNEAVTDVLDNGTFVCGQAGGGLPTVLGINQTADRAILMRGNNITNIGKLTTSGNIDGSLDTGDINVSDVYASDLNLSGDLNLGGNVLKNVGGTECGPGEALLGDGSCGATSDPQNLSQVLRQGNNTEGVDITVDGSNISSTTGNITFGNDVKIYGELYLPGSPSSEEIVHDLSEVLTAGSTANQSINMQNNTIRYVGPATSPGDATNKSYVDSSDDTIADDQSLSDVVSQGNTTGGTDIDVGGGEVTDTNAINPNGRKLGIGRISPSSQLDVGGGADIRGQLDLNDNNLVNVNQISGLSGDANKTFQYRTDTTGEWETGTTTGTKAVNGKLQLE